MTTEKSTTSTNTIVHDSDHPVVVIPHAKAFEILTKVQSASALAFSTFVVTHAATVVVTALRGMDAGNRTLVFGRVYYQHRALEKVVVVGAATVHFLSGLAKRGIRLYWKWRKNIRVSGDTVVTQRMESSTDEHGMTTTKKITTTTTFSHLFPSTDHPGTALLPRHHVVGYLLAAVSAIHYYFTRTLPRRKLGDSSLVDLSYVTVSLQRFPKSAYFTYFALIGLASYHLISGAPTAYANVTGNRKSHVADENAQRKSSACVRAFSSPLLVSSAPDCWSLVANSRETRSASRSGGSTSMFMARRCPPHG